MKIDLTDEEIKALKKFFLDISHPEGIETYMDLYYDDLQYEDETSPESLKSALKKLKIMK